MKRLRIGLLVASDFPQPTSHLPAVMRALSDAGAEVELVHPLRQAVDLASIRVAHDLYLLKKTSPSALSLAGVLHAQGAAILNPYPVTVALQDKIITSRILQRRGVPVPATYLASHPAQLAPLLSDGPLVVKPYRGSEGSGVRVIRNTDELAGVKDRKEPVFAQRYHQPQGRDRKVYVIGNRCFGVKKVFPARTEADRIGEPFTPSTELAAIARRCGAAFGIDFYSVDIIESGGLAYVVDMCSIPGCSGVPDAPQHLASYVYAAAEHAARGRAPQWRASTESQSLTSARAVSDLERR